MNTTEHTIRVWDPIVRIGHWILVVGFFVAYLTEDDLLRQHVWAGYAVGIVVCLRLVWGLVGTKYARFSNFVRSPSATLHYIRDLAAQKSRRYIGHNPAGGAMVVALLICLSATVVSGLVVYALEEEEGPLAGWVVDHTEPDLLLAAKADVDADHSEREDEEDEEEEHEGYWTEFWEEAHEISANITVLLVLLHIAGVLFSSYAHSENLIRGMITGRKRSDLPEKSDAGGKFGR